MSFEINEQQFIHGVKDHMEKDLAALFYNMPAALTSFICENCILTGGMSASYFDGDAPNDYDFYFKNALDILAFKDMVKQNYLELVSDMNEKYMETEVNGKSITVNAITFKNKVQVIILESAAIRHKFDFIHCMPYYDLKKYQYYISKEQFNSLREKKLVVNPLRHMLNPHHPTFIKRVQKYEARGWKL